MTQGVAFVLLVPFLDSLFSGDPATAWAWVAAVIAMFLVNAVLYSYGQYLAYRTGIALQGAQWQHIGRHLVRLPLGWFDASRTAEVNMLSTKGVVDLMGMPVNLFRPLVTAFCTPVVVLLGMALFDWRLAVAGLAAAPALGVILLLTNRLTARNERLTHAAATHSADRLLEFARLQGELRAFGVMDRGHTALDEAVLAEWHAGRRMFVQGVVGFIGFAWVVQATFTGLLVLGVYLFFGGSGEPAAIVGLVVLASRLIQPLVEAADVSGELRAARNSVDRLRSFLGTEVLPEPTCADDPPTTHDVRLDHVTFGYDPAAPVLSNLSFTARPGKTTALVGPSGAGKSTVVRLIARFWDPDEGAVLLGGVPLRDLPSETIMRSIAVVFQDVYLLADTIEGNIRLARPEATEAELRDVLRRARVDEIVDRLPDGLATRVGESGARLSGGERQRVAIARALLKDAPILLLDEPTSALDPENDAHVHAALTDLAQDRTVIIVAHRLQTIEAADQIIVLEDGRMVEHGVHEELLGARGRYHDLWAAKKRAAGWSLSNVSSP